MLGRVNTAGNGVSSISYADVLADADGWHLAQGFQQGYTMGWKLSDTLRVLFQEDGNERICRFYRERFGGSPQPIIDAYWS